MGSVRYIAYENKLAKLIRAPGGKTMEAAIEDAEIGLEAIADACLVDIDRLIAILIERAADLAKTVAKQDPLYTSAREIAGLAAICKRPRLGEAAHSLCVLIDNSEAAGQLHREAIAVHISTVQLLRGMPADGDERCSFNWLKACRDGPAAGATTRPPGPRSADAQPAANEMPNSHPGRSVAKMSSLTF